MGNQEVIHYIIGTCYGVYNVWQFLKSIYSYSRIYHKHNIM